MRIKFKNFILIIVIGFLILFVIIFWMAWKGYQLQKGEISIITDKTGYEPGGILKVKIKNNFGENICFSSCYPYLLQRKNEKWESYKYVECQKFDGNGHCLKAGELKAFELTLPEVSEGLHRLAIPVCIGCKSEDTFKEDKRFYSNEFTIKEKETEGVTIVTDKTEYERGEEVKFAVRNNTNKKIVLTAYDLMVEKLKENEWKMIRRWGVCCGECRPVTHYEIDINKILEFTWNQKTFACEMFGEIPEQMSGGKYRIKGKYFIEGTSEDVKTIYSDEFTIK